MINSFSESVYYFGNQIKSVATQIGNYVFPTWYSCITAESVDKIVAKTIEIAKMIFIVIASVALLMANPGFFTVSFVLGYFFDDYTKPVLNRVWERICIHPWPMAIAAGCAAWVSLPASIAVLSSVWALHWGSKLSFEAGQQLNSRCCDVAALGSNCT